MIDITPSASKILSIFDRQLNDNEQFYNILDQIGKHLIKISRLKESADRPGHLAEEVADIYILGRLLMQLEQVDDQTLKHAAAHFIEKVDGIYDA